MGRGGNLSAKYLFLIGMAALQCFICLLIPWFAYSPADGMLADRDPDLLLHRRRMEQVIGSGGSISILGLDRYSGYPLEHNYPYAPLMDWLGTRLAWGFFFFFPDSGVSPLRVFDLVPPLLGLFSLLFLMAAVLRWRGNIGFALLSGYALFVSPIFRKLFSYGNLDHHCLEAFFLGFWVLAGVLFAGRRLGERCALMIGSLLGVGLLTGWTGSPFAVGVSGILAGALLFTETDWARAFADYAAASLLAAGGLCLGGMWAGGMKTLSYAEFSLFQPAFALVVGGALFFWVRCPWSRWKTAPAMILVGSLVMVAVVGPVGISEGVANVAAAHPFSWSVGEQTPLFWVSNSNFFFAELFKDNGIYYFILPFVLFMVRRGVLGGAGAIILVFASVIFLLGCFHVRYFRWLLIFQGIVLGAFLREVIVDANRRMRDRKAFLPRLELSVCLAFVLVPYLGTSLEELRILPGKKDVEFIRAMGWLQAHSPEPGGYFDGKPPSYGVMSFWDHGNGIAFFAKRPAICDNLQYGLDHLAAVYAAPNEEMVYQRLEKIGGRYWLLSPPGEGTFEKIIPMLLQSTFKDGQLVLSGNSIDWKALKPIPLEKTFFGELFYALGLGLGDHPGSSRFRLVYVSNMKYKELVPFYSLFERVPGAVLSGVALPGATVTCRLPFTFPLSGGRGEYIRTDCADARGEFSIRVPNSTGYAEGGVRTGSSYLLSAFASGTVWMASTTLDLEAVRSGAEIRVVGKTVSRP